jgi:hypothetical protein
VITMRYKIGDPRYGMQALTNVSGTPGADPGADLPHTGQQDSPAPGHREQVGLDAPQHQDSYAAHLLAHAVQREHQAHYDRQRDTSPGAYLRHVFQGRA